MTKHSFAVLLALAAFSSSAFAAGKSTSASFQATFVVNEACAVQSEGKARPAVNCQFASPSQVSGTPAPTTSAASVGKTSSGTGANQPQLWTVTF